MTKKKKADKEPTLPFGKYRGRTLLAVMQEEPSYLCWFFESIEGCQDIKRAIVALPGFREEQAKHYERNRKKEASTRKLIEETVCRMLGAGQPPSSETLDSLCDELFNPEVE